MARTNKTPHPYEALIGKTVRIDDDVDRYHQVDDVCADSDVITLTPVYILVWNDTQNTPAGIVGTIMSRNVCHRYSNRPGGVAGSTVFRRISSINKIETI